MQHRRWWLAGFAAATLALITSATALGYAGQTPATITIAGPAGAVACGTDVTVTATITDSTGAPVTDQAVVWSFTSSPSAADKILHKTTNTDSSGVATTTVVLACVAGNRHMGAVAGPSARRRSLGDCGRAAETHRPCRPRSPRRASDHRDAPHPPRDDRCRRHGRTQDLAQPPLETGAPDVGATRRDRAVRRHRSTAAPPAGRGFRC